MLRNSLLICKFGVQMDLGSPYWRLWKVGKGISYLSKGLGGNSKCFRERTWYVHGPSLFSGAPKEPKPMHPMNAAIKPHPLPHESIPCPIVFIGKNQCGSIVGFRCRYNGVVTLSRIIRECLIEWSVIEFGEFWQEKGLIFLTTPNLNIQKISFMARFIENDANYEILHTTQFKGGAMKQYEMLPVQLVYSRLNPSTSSLVREFGIFYHFFWLFTAWWWCLEICCLESNLESRFDVSLFYLWIFTWTVFRASFSLFGSIEKGLT